MIKSGLGGCGFALNGRPCGFSCEMRVSGASVLWGAPNDRGSGAVRRVVSLEKPVASAQAGRHHPTCS